MRRPLALGLALAFELLSSRRAAAQSVDRGVAATLFQEGRQLMAEGKLDVACAKFEQSHRLDPGGGTVLNLATCREKQGKTATAWAAYREAVSLARRDGRPDREALGLEGIARLEPQLSRLTVSVTGRAPGLAVTLDGVAIGEVAYGTPLPVDPGEHRLQASAAGYLPWQGALVIGPSADQKEVVVPPLRPAPPPPPPAPAERRWYGWQTLAADGASIALIAVGSSSDASGLAVVGSLGLFLASPSVHWAHGHLGKGFASLGLRAGPTALLGVGLVVVDQGDQPSAGRNVAGGILIGLGALGALAAPVADSLALAREEVPASARGAKPAGPAPGAGAAPVSLTWAPRVWGRPGGAVLGVGGTF
ncbi:MAG TPA: hypothetical protein VFS43_20570 [Polyangiaceae bacterium]|nr:hypothetical protein [Polyangiaceae bacterium]